jgi:mono/diheme cytochrome c family protein/plastocyanin
MNTSKQINTIIGLLMIGAIATLLYYLWDGDRQSVATERQLNVNAERGGNLYSLNCRACHGLNGLGSLESSELPGLPLNTDANREADEARQAYIRGTIECGRVGTRMPPWSQKYGGPLNDFQIDQMMALITGQMPDFEQDPDASVLGWEFSVEASNHSDTFAPAKELEESVSAEADTFVLNNAQSMRPGIMLRVGGSPEETEYEVVQIVDTPAWSALTEEASADAEELSLQEAFVFNPGDVIIVGGERMEVVEAPAGGALAADITAEATEIELEDAEGFEQGQTIVVQRETMTVESVSGNTLTVERGADDTEAALHVAGTVVVQEGTTITVERGLDGTEARKHTFGSFVTEEGEEIVVERGAFGTDAAEHEAGTEIFNGPIIPSDSITGAGEGFPPCGQLPPSTDTGGAAADVPVEAAVDVTMGDNFFDAGGNQNPNFVVPTGATVTFNLTNDGAAPHNMNIAGADNEFETDDDAISDPDLITAGQAGTLQFTAAAAGTVDYRCDFHPDQMQGTITVE